MDISKFLSKAIGIYLIIISIAMFINLPQFESHVNLLIGNAPLMFITGIFTLILGIIAVLIHNIWQWNWRVFITIIVWITLLKGVSLLIYPQFIDKITTLFLQNYIASYIAAGLDFILGVLLCYFGFRR